MKGTVNKSQVTLFADAEAKKMRLRGKEGFSLIEVMIALTILAIGLLAVGELQVAAIRSLAYSRHLSSATQLGEQELELLRTLPYVPDNESTVPTDEHGTQITSILDGVAGSPFRDLSSGTQGDNAPSHWHTHADNPLNAQGNPARTDEVQFYVRWQIERGPLNSATSFKIPGIKQLRIRLQVIWWENKNNLYASQAALQHPSAATLSGWNDDSDLRKIHAHWINLETMRQLDL
jgi:prepilin-type N-terminal cleavage/methylation domain-containing protein